MTPDLPVQRVLQVLQDPKVQREIRDLQDRLVPPVQPGILARQVRLVLQEIRAIQVPPVLRV